MQIHNGPYGTCPDCKKLTPVRIHSLTAPIKAKEWACDHAMLREILLGVRGAAKEGTHTIKKKNAAGDFDKQVVTCKLAHCTKCGTSVSRLFWIELGEALSAPFCSNCVKREIHHMESADGQQTTARLFSYGTSVNAVARALLVTDPSGTENVAMLDEDGSPDGENTDEGLLF